jgi:hypothetical protein
MPYSRPAMAGVSPLIVVRVVQRRPARLILGDVVGLAFESHIWITCCFESAGMEQRGSVVEMWPRPSSVAERWNAARLRIILQVTYGRPGDRKRCRLQHRR